MAPIHGYAERGEEERVRRELDRGVKVNLKGMAPLHLAAKWGHHETVFLLLKNGAFPNVQNSEGETPLHFAATWNHVQTANILVNFGASVDILDHGYASPLHFAAEKGRKEMVEMLVERGGMVYNEDWEQTPLHWAAIQGFPQIAEILVKGGCPMNVPDSNDVTPIHVAAGCHNYSFCYFLIQSGCCVLIKDKVQFSLAWKKNKKEKIAREKKKMMKTKKSLFLNYSFILSRCLSFIPFFLSFSVTHPLLFLHQNSKGMTPLDYVHRSPDNNLLVLLFQLAEKKEILQALAFPPFLPPPPPSSLFEWLPFLAYSDLQNFLSCEIKKLSPKTHKKGVVYEWEEEEGEAREPQEENRDEIEGWGEEMLMEWE